MAAFELITEEDNFDRRNRNQFPYCCPDPCDYIEDRTEAERAEQKAKQQESRREWWRSVWKVLTTLATPIIGFFKLPWQNQLVIGAILLFGWALVTHQLNTALEIVKALRGSK
jgi:hypothetical protein